MPKDPDEKRPAEKSWYYLREDERYGPVPVSAAASVVAVRRVGSGHTGVASGSEGLGPGALADGRHSPTSAQIRRPDRPSRRSAPEGREVDPCVPRHSTTLDVGSRWCLGSDVHLGVWCRYRLSTSPAGPTVGCRGQCRSHADSGANGACCSEPACVEWTAGTGHEHAADSSCIGTSRPDRWFE